MGARALMCDDLFHCFHEENADDEERTKVKIQIHGTLDSNNVDVESRDNNLTRRKKVEFSKRFVKH